MPNDHRGRDVHGGKVTDDASYSFSADDILGAFDPYQESKLRTLGYEQDEPFPPGPLRSFSTKDGKSDITVPKPSSGGDWPVVRTVHGQRNWNQHPTALSTHSLGRLPDGRLRRFEDRLPVSPRNRFVARSHPPHGRNLTSGKTMDFWDATSSGDIGSEGTFRTPYRAALAAAAMSKRAADPTLNLRTGKKMDNV